jgi:hypothetical protein
MIKFALALLVASSLSAQSELPVIHSIENGRSTYQGGSLFTVHGERMALICGVAPCGEPRVLLGSTAAQVVSFTPETIVARANPHRIGAFDVTVERQDHATATVRSAFTYFSEAARETVLLPLVLRDAAAGYQSRWATELSITNRTDAAITIAPIGLLVDPKSTVRNPSALNSISGEGTAGRLLYLPRDLADKLTINLRVHELTRDDESLGVELPVVHETDFRVEEIALGGITADPRYRLGLRIYTADFFDPNGNTAQTFWVRVFDRSGTSDESQPLVSTFVNVTNKRSNNANAGILLYPGTYEIADLAAAFPQLAGHEELGIVVSPVFLSPVVSPRVPLFWAFVSSTNNQTQEVTLVTPD